MDNSVYCCPFPHIDKCHHGEQLPPGLDTACPYALLPTAALHLNPALHLLEAMGHSLGKPRFFLHAFHTTSSQPGVSSTSTRMPEKLCPSRFSTSAVSPVLPYLYYPRISPFKLAEDLIIFLVVLVTLQYNGPISPSASHLLVEMHLFFVVFPESSSVSSTTKECSTNVTEKIAQPAPRQQNA